MNAEEKQGLAAALPERLLPWYREHARALPWRRDRAPYHVWLSEIMLQQTRVEAVRGYYSRFLETCPDIPALAACPPEVLNKLCLLYTSLCEAGFDALALRSSLVVTGEGRIDEQSMQDVYKRQALST